MSFLQICAFTHITFSFLFLSHLYIVDISVNVNVPCLDGQPGLAESVNGCFFFFFYINLHFAYRGFPTRMVYLYYISCLRYTLLVGNPRLVYCHGQQVMKYCLHNHCCSLHQICRGFCVVPLSSPLVLCRFHFRVIVLVNV